MDVSGLVDLVAFIVSCINAVATAVNGGKKFDLQEIVEVLRLMRNLPSVVENLGGDLPAWESLTEDQKALLYVEIKKLDLGNETVEAIAEEIFNVIIAAGPILGKLIKKPAA